jgi:hypothetical protein
MHQRDINAFIKAVFKVSGVISLAGFKPHHLFVIPDIYFLHPLLIEN